MLVLLSTAYYSYDQRATYCRSNTAKHQNTQGKILIRKKIYCKVDFLCLYEVFVGIEVV